MLLYHGTSESAAKTILRSGAIKPRGRRRHNWPDRPSRVDRVYLSRAYAPFYAAVAAKTERLAILQVELDRLDRSRLVPDEDFLQQVPGEGQQWSASLDNLGSLAHLGPIPIEAISRAVFFDPKKAPQLHAAFLDPCISLMNYRLCGARYRALTHWIMGEPVTALEMFTSFGLAEWEFMPEQWRRECEALAEDRTCLEVMPGFR